MSYSTAAGGWHDFYVIAGTASATLVGLLFVGLSLHLRVVVAHLDVRALARVTLANFGLLLFVALIMVIPQAQSDAAYQLVGSGLASLAIVAPSLVAAGRRHGRMLRWRQLALRFGVSAVSYVAVLVAGVVLLSSSSSAFRLLVIATFVLLVVSLRNTWDLLVTVGEVTASGEGKR